MHLHGFLRDEQSLSDITISVTARHMAQHLDFTMAKRFVTKMFRKPGGYLGRNALLAGVDLANCLDHLRRRHGFQQVTARPGLQNPANLDIAFKGGKNNDASVGKLHPNIDHDLDAIQIRKLKIHQRYVRSQCSPGFNGFFARGSGPNHRHVRLVVDHGGNTFP